MNNTITTHRIMLILFTGLALAACGGEITGSSDGSDEAAKNGVAITLHQAGDSVTVELSGDIIRYVEFYVNEELSPFAKDDSSPFNATLSTLGLTAGEHLIRAVIVIDVLGEQSTITRIKKFVVVDTGGTNPDEPIVDQPKLLEMLLVQHVRASSHDGNVPENTLDDDSSTRWSADGVGAWIEFDFARSNILHRVDIAWYRGDIRQASFKIDVSSDAENWQQVFSGESGGSSLLLEPYDIVVSPARFVRVTGLGNNQNTWNSITSVRLFGEKGEASDEIVAPAPPEETIGNNYSLLGDPDFDINTLSAAARSEYATVLSEINNPNNLGRLNGYI